MGGITIYREVEVEVDVDPSDFDEDEIVDLCIDLGYAVIKVSEGKEPSSFKEELDALAEAYRLNDSGLMLKLRDFLEAYTGRLLT